MKGGSFSFIYFVEISSRTSADFSEMSLSLTKPRKMSGFYPLADTPPATPPPLLQSSIRVLWLCEIVETSARGAPQSSVKLHVKRDTPPISANFIKFQQLFLIGKFYTEFHEILSLAKCGNPPNTASALRCRWSVPGHMCVIRPACAASLRYQ